MKYVLGWGKQLNRGVKKRSEKGEEKEGERKKKTVLNFHRGFIFLRRVHGVCLQFLCVINSKHLIKRTDKYTGFTICVYSKRKVFTAILLCRADVKPQWGIAQ